MRKKAAVVVSIILVLCASAFFFDPVVHQSVATSNAPSTSRPDVSYTVYKSLGCLTLGLGDTVVGHGFTLHKGIYLSCTTPPLAPQTSRN